MSNWRDHFPVSLQLEYVHIYWTCIYLFTTGVEAFLRAIQEQVQGQGEGSERSRDNNTDQDYPEGDRMDED